MFPVVLKVLSVHKFYFGPVDAYAERDTIGRFVYVLLLMIRSKLTISKQNIRECLSDFYLIMITNPNLSFVRK